MGHEKKVGEDEFELIREYIYPANLSWDTDKLAGNAYPEYSWGANVVEVEVDPVTFVTAIKGIWAVYDIGTPIDETIVQGQIEGGIVQGLGYGSMEVLQAKEGKLLKDTLTGYMIPSAVDFPGIAIELIDNPFAGGHGARVRRAADDRRRAGLGQRNRERNRQTSEKNPCDTGIHYGADDGWKLNSN